MEQLERLSANGPWKRFARDAGSVRYAPIEQVAGQGAPAGTGARACSGKLFARDRESPRLSGSGEVARQGEAFKTGSLKLFARDHEWAHQGLWWPAAKSQAV
jgi:hypothetical protein